MNTESARSYWERNAKRYDRSMKILGGPMPAMIARIAQAVRGAERVLEVAAGTGLVTCALAAEAREVVATDYAEEMVRALEAKVRAAGLDNVKVARADLYALDTAPGSFDAVVAANVLHLVPDLPGALASLRSALRPGGLLLAPTYCHAETWRTRSISRLLALTGFPGQRRFTLATLAGTLEEAGARVTERELLPGLLPIGYVAARFPAQ